MSRKEQIMGIDVPWTSEDEAALEGAFRKPVADLAQGWTPETARLISDLRLQVHKLKAALMAAGVPQGTVERIAQTDETNV